MDKYVSSRFIRTWCTVLAAALVALVIGLGYNSITGSINLSDGITGVRDLFGGKSFVVVALSLVFIAITTMMMNRLAKTDYSNDTSGRRARVIWYVIAIVMMVLIIIALAGDLTTGGFGALWPTILRTGVLFVIVTVAALVITPRLEARATKSK